MEQGARRNLLLRKLDSVKPSNQMTDIVDVDERALTHSHTHARRKLMGFVGTIMLVFFGFIAVGLVAFAIISTYMWDKEKDRLRIRLS